MTLHRKVFDCSPARGEGPDSHSPPEHRWYGWNEALFRIDTSWPMSFGRKIAAEVGHTSSASTSSTTSSGCVVSLRTEPRFSAHLETDITDTLGPDADGNLAEKGTLRRSTHYLGKELAPGCYEAALSVEFFVQGDLVTFEEQAYAVWFADVVFHRFPSHTA